MPFNSIRYLLFLGIMVLLYWKLPLGFRKSLLLIASYIFYMSWLPSYGLLIFGLTIVNYWFGLKLREVIQRRRDWLWFTIAFNLAILGFFKYTNFILDNLCKIAGVVGWDFKPQIPILLPLGISFLTFEFIHYLVDVYKGSPPIRSWLDFAIFSSFFPTRIAGPIRRYQDFIPQISTHSQFEEGKFYQGLWLILRGLFKKVVLADNLSLVVSAGFGSPLDLGLVDTWIVVLAFAFQIYFDFSGYTDTARGSAALLGFSVPENFKLPYLSLSIADFWRRWHISFANWLRDYLYIPLGGNKCSRVRNYLNLFLTMALGGLWHGASWTFVIWGMYHGFGLILHREWQRLKGTKDLGRAISILLTFLFVGVGWVFFRAGTFRDALEIILRMAVVGAPRLVGDLNPDHWITTGTIFILYIVYLMAVQWVTDERRLSCYISYLWLGKSILVAAMILSIFAFPGGQTAFIYFQF